MVYKKYIKRDGKVYGPYIYRSRKIKGKVITEYLGKGDEKNKNKLHLIFPIVGLISILSLIFILNYSGITGFVVSNEIVIESETDGYGLEGYETYSIRGSQKYERCLKVDSTIDFSSVIIRAKVEQVVDGGDLYYEIYSHDFVNDEPEIVLGNCDVLDLAKTEWGSCQIRLDGNPDSYWVCAYSLGGDISSDYYKIYWSNQDTNKKRAFWTGSSWQKMDEASYTIEAEFWREK